MHKARIVWVDTLRAFAIILMIIFHLLWDLNQFNIVHINIFSFYMLWFKNIIIFLFLFLVGYSLEISYKNFIYKKFAKRISMLFFVSILISIGSYLIYPLHWIYFGIIHFIFLATIVGILFVSRYKLAFIIAIIIFVLYYFDIGFSWLKYYAINKLHLPNITYDLLSFIPWFGVVLLGIFFYPIVNNLDIKEYKFFYIIKFLSSHSLMIYLFHQPLLFGFLIIFFT